MLRRDSASDSEVTAVGPQDVLVAWSAAQVAMARARGVIEQWESTLSAPRG